MESSRRTNRLPSSLDVETSALVKDLIDTLAQKHPDIVAIILYGSVARHEERSLDAPDPSDVDLLVILDSEDPHVSLHQADALFHTLGLAYSRHLDAPREVKVMFSSRTLQEWDSTFIANVMRDGIILFSRGSLPAPFAA